MGRAVEDLADEPDQGGGGVGFGEEIIHAKPRGLGDVLGDPQARGRDDPDRSGRGHPSARRIPLTVGESPRLATLGNQSGLPAVLGEPALGLDRRGAAHAGGGDGLPVNMIRAIARDVDAGDIGLHL